MNKYHITKSGKVAKCNAKKQCPLQNSLHSNSIRELQEFIDQREKEMGILAWKMNLPNDPISIKQKEYNGYEAAQRTEFVQSVINKYYDKPNMHTDDKYQNKETYEWAPERAKIHNEIINEIMKQYENVPCERKVIFSAGLPGAGKTTVLTKEENLDLSQWATVSADDFKEILANRNMIPEIEGLTPMECSTFVHQESSYLSTVLIRKLSEQGKNIIYDFTCKSRRKTESIINTLIKENLYSSENMQFIYVDIDPEIARERAKSRYQRGLTKYVLGENNIGGRFLPESVIDSCIPVENNGFSTINAENLVKLYNDSRYKFPTPIVYENTKSATKISYEDFIISH